VWTLNSRHRRWRFVFIRLNIWWMILGDWAASSSSRWICAGCSGIGQEIARKGCHLVLLHCYRVRQVFSPSAHLITDTTVYN
jgi:hypothetical protein